MANLLDEERLSLSDLARAKGVNLSTVWRWCTLGCRGG
jgi:hypothetical protein